MVPAILAVVCQLAVDPAAERAGCGSSDDGGEHEARDDDVHRKPFWGREPKPPPPVAYLYQGLTSAGSQFA